MTGARNAPDDPVVAGFAPLMRLPEVFRRLGISRSVGELFAAAAVAGCEACGFTRGVVLTVGHGHLSAGETEPLEDRASEALRRRALADPIKLVPGSDEAELIRVMEGGRRRAATHSQLGQTLGLEQVALGAIAPESRVLALLVMDRTGPPVDEVDRAAVAVFSAMLAVAVSHLVLKGRVRELSQEFRYLTASSEAMMGEVLEAPVSLPLEGRYFPASTALGAFEARGRGGNVPLTEREQQVASLMVEGRSNREIADQLMLSPATVKDHVARILRKVNASNRVEAVSRLLGVHRPGPD